MKDMKAAERRYLTRRKVEKRLKQAQYSMTWWWPDSEELKSLEDQHDRNRRKGSFKSRAPMDCGHSRCYLCHSEKLNSIADRQAGEADLSYHEALLELGLI